jgi:Zn-dependent metalloprotease
MKRTTRLGVVSLTLGTMFALVIGGGVPASGQSNDGGSRSVAAAAIQRLRSDAVGTVTVRIDRGTKYVGFVRVARGGDLFPESRSTTAHGKARGFFARYQALFGIKDASSELRQVSSTKDAYGFTHVSYEQTYEGLPVFAGLVRAHLDRSGRLTAVNGTFAPNVDLNTDPMLSPAQAAQKAIADVTANPPTTEDGSDPAVAAPSGLRAASTTLEVYRTGLVRNVPGANQLVYEVEVTNGADIREFVFVHANAGKIVNRYSGVHNALSRVLYELSANTPPIWQEGDPFPGALNQDQQNILIASEDAYYLFLHAFGRDSYDAAGAQMRSVNNDPTISCPNANWNGATTNYCNGVTADDVVAHEWGHAYTQYTHDLIYQWQSGALNEAYSDIWGETADFLNGVGTDAPGGTRTAGGCTSHTLSRPFVMINSPASIAGFCTGGAAAFGPALEATGPVTGDLVLANDGRGAPADACTRLRNGGAVEGNIALVDRGLCTFTEKVKNAQIAGAIGVLVADNVWGPADPLAGADPTITIPSVRIPLGIGNTIKSQLGTGVNVTMRINHPSPQDNYRWNMGEDATAFGTPGRSAIRDMWNPRCVSDPGRVTDAEYFCASTDGGGVHTNSGVPNHGFALLVDGGTFNGQTVGAIGLTKAAHLYWRAQSVYQTPSTDFPDHAEALETSCADLVGLRLSNLGTDSSPPRGARPSITTADCASVAAMTAAVELRTDPTTQCNFQPILQPDAPLVCGDEPATEVFVDDFETGLDGWTLTNQGVFSGWPGLDWTTDSTLPADREGAAAFAADPNIGDCGGGANDVSGMMSMQSPVITLPSGTPRLSFTHYLATEAGWDGGNVWISVNGRAFTQIPAAAFLFNPYNATLQTAAAGNTNPMAGQPAFTGTDAGELVSSWGTSIVDLTATGTRIRTGDTVQFRFDMGMDGCTGIDGWYVDDVTVSVCGATAAVREEESTSS